MDEHQYVNLRFRDGGRKDPEGLADLYDRTGNMRVARTLAAYKPKGQWGMLGGNPMTMYGPLSKAISQPNITNQYYDPSVSTEGPVYQDKTGQRYLRDPDVTHQEGDIPRAYVPYGEAFGMQGYSMGPDGSLVYPEGYTPPFDERPFERAEQRGDLRMGIQDRLGESIDQRNMIQKHLRGKEKESQDRQEQMRQRILGSQQSAMGRIKGRFPHASVNEQIPQAAAQQYPGMLGPGSDVRLETLMGPQGEDAASGGGGGGLGSFDTAPIKQGIDDAMGAIQPGLSLFGTQPVDIKDLKSLPEARLQKYTGSGPRVNLDSARQANIAQGAEAKRNVAQTMGDPSLAAYYNAMISGQTGAGVSRVDAQERAMQAEQDRFNAQLLASQEAANQNILSARDYQQWGIDAQNQMRQEQQRELQRRGLMRFGQEQYAKDLEKQKHELELMKWNDLGPMRRAYAQALKKGYTGAAKAIDPTTFG